jgi:mannose-6-phosphate isomerase
LTAGEDEQMEAIDGPSLIIVTSGDGTMEFGSGTVEMKEGSVWFVGAGKGITLKSSKGMVTHRAFVEA